MGSIYLTRENYGNVSSILNGTHNTRTEKDHEEDPYE